jgi:hypothetical protein
MLEPVQRIAHERRVRRDFGSLRQLLSR